MKKEKGSLQTETIQTKEVPVKEGGKKKITTGVLVCILLGLLLLLLGLWLCTKTLGTQLLFTDVTIGRVSRYWFIPVILGLVLLMTAVRFFARKPKQAQEKKEEPIVSETAAGEALHAAETPGAEDGTGDAVGAPESVTEAGQTIMAEAGAEKI